MNERVPAHSLAWFRVALGAVVAWSMLRYIGRGWVTSQLTEPEFHVSYPGLWWVRPLPAPWMHLLLLVTAAGAVALALGWHARAAAIATLAGFFWVESVDAATYLNHYELVTLLLAWATVLPLASVASLDRRAGRARGDGTVPAGAVWIVRGQLALVYLFAGIAKLQYDWLVRAQPIRTWFAARGDLFLVGPLLERPATAFVAAWAGALLDLTVVPLLLWHRTRLPAYVALLVFHAATWWLFPSIGLFPIAMVAFAPVFFAPDWPRRIRRRTARAGQAPVEAAPKLARPVARGRAVVAGIALVAAVQVALPLRHWFVPGDVRWDDYHSRWSWRVMLTERAGVATFDLVDPITGTRERVLPDDVLPPHLVRYVSTRPEALRQFAHHLADRVERDTGRRPHVFVTAWVTVNGTRRARIVDPDVDLAAEPSSPSPPDWVLPAPWS